MSASAMTVGQAGGGWKALAGRSEIWMATAAIGIVMMLILPVPPAALDLLLVFNLALSLAVLLVTAYLHSPLELSVFPSLLLFTALFRLALSIALMRAILTLGFAGSVVDAFGQMVLSGNYVVGFALFLTLVIVQFIVVTGGIGRVAEVVARFTLDAMPGKQMAIDADLNNGSITEEEARRRRRDVARESDFFGAMDGASKFVKGDGIAALVVTAINLTGGIIIGVVQMGLDIKGALEVFALLTVGQGLVIQIPGLLMSVASGLIVSRSAAENNLSVDLFRQLTGRPEALSAAAAGCFALAILPGLPKPPLLLLGAGLMFLARVLPDAHRAAAEAEALAAAEAETEQPREAEDMRQHLPLDALVLEVGYGLVPLALQGEGTLLDRITQLRRQVAEELGLVVPPVRVRDNNNLRPNNYVFYLRGAQVAQGEILPRFFMALNSGTVADPIDGEHVADPVFGLPGVWIGPDQRRDAERRGYMVVDAPSICITHLGEVIRQHAAELLTREELAGLIEVIKAQAPAIVEDLVPGVVTKADLQLVLQNLLDERVSIRNMIGIVEALGEAASRTNSTDDMTEYVRMKLARVFLSPFATNEEIPALVIDPGLERRLADGITETAFGNQLQVSPALLQQFIDSLSQQIEAAAADGQSPVLVCMGRLRLPLRRMMRKFLSRLVVISYDEIAETRFQLRTLGMINVEQS